MVKTNLNNHWLQLMPRFWKKPHKIDLWPASVLQHLQVLLPLILGLLCSKACLWLQSFIDPRISITITIGWGWKQKRTATARMHTGTSCKRCHSASPCSSPKSWGPTLPLVCLHWLQVKLEASQIRLQQKRKTSAVGTKKAKVHVGLTWWAIEGRPQIQEARLEKLASSTALVAQGLQNPST